MSTLSRRLRVVESRRRARASPAGNRSPEEVADRERQFEELRRKLGMPWPPEPKDREEAFEELFEEIEAHREEIERREQQ